MKFKILHPLPAADYDHRDAEGIVNHEAIIEAESEEEAIKKFNSKYRLGYWSIEPMKEK